MPRVKGGYTTRRRRKAILKLAKGYFGSKRTLYKTAHEQVMRSLSYAYRDRKVNKRNFRKLWISRINAACKANDFKYSLMINGLKKAGVVVNRKMLAELAIFEPAAFTQLVEVAKKGLSGEMTPALVAEEKTAAKVEASDAVDYEAMKVADLREIAKDKGISGFSTMKKAELIEALTK